MDWFVSLILIVFAIIYYCIPAALIIMLPMVVKEIVCWVREIWIYIREGRKKY